MFRKVARIGSTASKVRVTICVKKCVLGDASFSSLKNISVVFERGGRQVSSSSRDVVVVASGGDGGHHCEVEFNEDLILDVTLYGQMEEGRLVFHEKIGRLILRQNKGRGGVMGKEVFQELGVVTLLLHQICGLQMAQPSKSVQPYTLPIAKIRSPGSVIEVDISCIQMKVLQIDDDAMSDASGYSDVSSHRTENSVFARLMGSPPASATASTGGSGRAQQAPTASNISGSSATEGLESRLAIMQMNLDRCSADRDNIEALHLETQRELAQLKQQAADASLDAQSPPPSDTSASPPPSVEAETLRIEVRRLQSDAAVQQAEREALASQLAGAQAQAQQHSDALERERVERQALQRQLEQLAQQQRQQLQGDGLQAELSRSQAVVRSQAAQLEELQKKDKITEGFILDKTRRLEAQLEQARVQLLQFTASSERQAVLEQERVRLERLLAQARADLLAERLLVEEARQAHSTLQEEMTQRAQSHGSELADHNATQERMQAAALAHKSEVALLESHIEAMQAASVNAEARLQSQLMEQASRHAQMVQSSSDATSLVYLQLAEKDRAHGEALSALLAQLDAAARERDESKEMAQRLLADKDRAHGETMRALQGQLAEVTRAQEAATIIMQRRVDTLETEAAEHATERAASLEQISALQLNSSESTSRLSAQLSELSKVHAAEAKVWQAQMDAAASGHASIKAALLQQIAAAEMDQHRLIDAHREELGRSAAAVQALTRQLAEQSSAASSLTEVAATKTDFLQGCLREERKAVRELRAELAEAHGRLDIMTAELTHLRIATDRDEQHAAEIELLQRSALQQRAAQALEAEGLSAQLLSAQSELLALQEAHVALQTHARGLESATEDGTSHRQQLAEQVVEMQALRQQEVQLREAAQADGQVALAAARAEIASLQALLEEGEAAVRSIAAENQEYAARNEALQAQQTLLSLEQMEKDTSAANVVLQIASLKLQLAQQREERATMEAALKQQISELTDSVQAHSVITLEASLGIERERETSDLEALGQQFAEREREKERWAHEATVKALSDEVTGLREELREREIELEHTASALAGYLAGGKDKAAGGKGGKRRANKRKGRGKDEAGVGVGVGAEAVPAQEPGAGGDPSASTSASNQDRLAAAESESESDTDDSMDGQGEAAYVQEKLDAANDALRHMSLIVDAERTKVMTIRHVLMKFTRQFAQADTEMLLQAGVILEQQASR